MNALQRDLTRTVARIERQDAPKAAADPYYPQFHLAPVTGWLNDPNGLCRVGDTYHVFYQYGPMDPRGGVKHWGHATGTDLLHWQRQPVMLYPDMPFDCHGAYSGSALVEDGTLYLYYTGNVKYPGDFDYITAGRGHNTCLAISRDGVTLDRKICLLENRDYPADLTCHVRDPKVFVYEGRYYMVLGARTKDDVGEVLVYVSDNKLDWTLCNTLKTPQPFGYMWECPDLFELDGQWFLAVSPQGAPSQNVYACGVFPVYGDWRGAYTLGAFQPMDYGFDFYAPQSFADGARRLSFGWMAMPDADYAAPATLDYGWQHCLTVPCELHAKGDKLLRTPAPELTKLRRKGDTLHFAPGTTCDAGCFALDLQPDAPASPFALSIADGLTLRYADGALTLEFTDPTLGAGRTTRTAPVAHLDNLQVIGDTSTLEIFANDGEITMSTRYFPPAQAKLCCTEGAARATCWELSL